MRVLKRMRRPQGDLPQGWRKRAAGRPYRVAREIGEVGGLETHRAELWGAACCQAFSVVESSRSTDPWGLGRARLP